MSRPALTPDGCLLLPSPPVLPALPALPASKTPTCSLLTHLHKVGSDLALRLAHPVLAASLWAILPHKDGSHLVRVSRPTDLVLGTTTLSLQVHHQLVCRDLQVCHNNNSNAKHP